MKTTKTMIKTVKMMELCEKWYPKKKLSHALRVASYAFDMARLSSVVTPEDAYLVGLAHDLIEDTECPQDELQDILESELFTAVITLTKSDDVKYIDYIHEILDSKDELAILVKRADMKDHLMQTETLTDKLKEKYFPVVGLLL